jgi:hypothetical protein
MQETKKKAFEDKGDPNRYQQTIGLGWGQTHLWYMIEREARDLGLELIGYARFLPFAPFHVRDIVVEGPADKIAEFRAMMTSFVARCERGNLREAPR